MAKIELHDDYIRQRERPVKGSVIDYDTLIQGFAVRFTPNGHPSFLFCYGGKGGSGSQRRMVIGKWDEASGKTRSSVVAKMRSKARDLRELVVVKRDPYAEELADAARLRDEREAEQRERERTAKAEEETLRLEAAQLTVNELCDRYLLDHGHKLRPKTKRAGELRMNRYVRPAWGTRKAKDISKADVIALLKPLRAAGKRSEVVHVLSLVTGLFNFAVDDDDLECIAVNPALGLKKKLVAKSERPQPRERALTTPREFRAFYLVTRPGASADKAVAKPMHVDEAACLRFMMLTGCRPSEAAGIEWSEIDFHAKLWNKPADVEGRSKSRRADVVPLVSDAVEILQARRGNGSAYVFPAQRGMGKKPLTENRLARALRGVGPRLVRMGVASFTPHDLRRTVTTGLFDTDVSEYIVKRTLNHSTKGVTDIHYNKSAMLRQRRAALEGWSAYLQRMIRGRTPEMSDNVVPFAVAGGR